jgi:hypothetical protein
MSGLAAVAVTVLSACIGQFGHGFFPVILNKRVRDAVCISSGVLMTIWWSVFFFVIVQRLDFTTSQLDVAVTWGFIAPFGAFVGLVTGLQNAAQNKSVAIVSIAAQD